MKKLLLALTVTMAMAVGAQNVFAADCGECKKPKDDCGCKMEKMECDEPAKCESCGDMAKMCFTDCRDQKREEIYCRLNLDDCQRGEAKTIEDKYDCDLDTINDQIKADHKCLCQTLNASCLDKPAVRSAEKTLKSDIKDMKSKLKCIDKEFKGILKCDQKREYRKIKREMKYVAKKSMKYCCKPCKK